MGHLERDRSLPMESSVCCFWALAGWTKADDLSSSRVELEDEREAEEEEEAEDRIKLHWFWWLPTNWWWFGGSIRMGAGWAAVGGR